MMLRTTTNQMQLILPQQQQQQIRTIGAGPRDGFDVPVKFTPPYMEERCANLIQWTRAQYTVDNNVGYSHYDNNDDDNNNTEIPQQYGVYSETPDLVPLVGHWNKDDMAVNDTTSRICHLVGCNAWGQTILSYCSSLIPGLLGYRDLTESEKDCLRLLTIRRFAPRVPSVPVHDDS